MSTISQGTAKQSSEASGLMRQVGGDMEDLRRRAHGLSQSMLEMRKASGEISGMVAVISKIAFQTNLLALNEAVEAARAGETGKGFSVVADEVRTLAQNSAAETDHISELVEASIAKTRIGEQDLAAVLAGVESVAQQSLRASTAIESINAAESEQARGIQQIAHSILEMQQVTEGTAASAEAGVKTSEDLWQNAEDLQQVVHELTWLTGVGV